MNGSEFFEQVAQTTSFDAKGVKVIGEAIFAELRNQATKGESVTISNVCRVQGVQVAERIGRNVRTGEKVVTPAHRAVRINLAKQYRNI